MFDSIEGELSADEATRIVLRVPMGEGAISYELRTPLGTGARLPRNGRIARCWVATSSVDDLPRLFGFASQEERELFGLVRKVSGVGPSLALALLSADAPERLLQAIEAGDAKFLQRIKGIGKKTAERICLELQDRASKLLQTLGFAGSSVEAAPALSPVQEDAIAALVSLGFAELDAHQRIEKLPPKLSAAPVEELIKAALAS
ncbi:MAG: Holliday junction branch migration protein RuvA [Planctomycetota bacterium]|nr:MAG: Holliday junction branch migration protein RuvA [Planctomycetota bacterium]